MQHRRLRLRSASQGSAPAPAAQHHSTATKENQEHLTRMQTGNSVSPLDKTYHGGPRTIWQIPPIVNGPPRKRLINPADRYADCRQCERVCRLFTSNNLGL